MYKWQLRTQSTKANVSPPEPNYSTIARPEHSNTSETQENDLKVNIIKMIEGLKEKVKKSLNQIVGKTNEKMEEKYKSIYRAKKKQTNR